MLVLPWTLGWPLLGAVLAVVSGMSTVRAAEAEATAGPPKFHLPVNCTVGLTCEIQFHVDLAPGPEIVDHACGRLTYDGHKGTDFRVPDLPAMRAGVSVLAAAAGTVRAIRDGEPDISVDERGRENLEGKDAGNAVVIDHGDGWETQYSHLMKGSVEVKAGDRVEAGQVIGAVGATGRATGPHMHWGMNWFDVRVDPQPLLPAD